MDWEPAQRGHWRGEQIHCLREKVGQGESYRQNWEHQCEGQENSEARWGWPLLGKGSGWLNHRMRAFLILFFLLFILNNFLLGYIHYTGGISVIIPIRLILYISYIAPFFLSLSPLPTPLKASQEVS
jgi:hypothetical protein